jgi:UDP-2,4-diacetamido-2,4,6-trideoxy-beta-L-altropyranose hydrolase
MKPVVYIRCDGGTDIGMGHVVRCLALAHMLREFFDVTFIIQETDNTVYQWINGNGFSYQTITRCQEETTCASLLVEALNASATKGSIVVLDGYQLQTHHQQRLKEHGYSVVAIDDLHSWHHVSDAILNHAPEIDASAYEAEKYTRFLLGTDFALLRPSLLKAATQKRSIKPVNNFLISMGAADTNNYTDYFANSIIRLFPKANIHLLVSSLNPHLASLSAFAKNAQEQIQMHINLSTEELTQLLMQTDVVICPASTISIEACAAGCTLITGYTASNQSGILAGLEKAQACFSLGAFADLNKTYAESRIQSWLNDESLRTIQMHNQRRLIDGKSGIRVALAFLEIAKNIRVRKALHTDSRLYFQWANDAQVRANSYQTAPIEWDTHEQWFNATVGSPSHALYLYSMSDIPAGQIRLRIEETNAIIHFSVATDFRGQGLGKWMLQHIVLYTRLHHPHVSKLQGWVKKKNNASMRAFQSSGYLNVEENDESVLFQFDLHSQ